MTKPADYDAQFKALKKPVTALFLAAVMPDFLLNLQRRLMPRLPGTV